jgi:putative PEP-CTERM system histidine kinase
LVSLGLISYGFAAFGFLVLTLLLATSWEGRGAGVRLILACATTTVWSGVIAFGAYQGSLPVPVLLVIEVLRYGAWFLVIADLAGAIGIGRGLILAMHGVWLGALALLGIALVTGTPGSSANQQLPLLVYGGMALSLTSLVMLEQVIRNAREMARYSLKYLLIALGAMFAYDLFLFAQAQLVHGIEPASWDARGIVTALTIPLVAIAAQRNPRWSLNIFVSRQVVFYSTSFIAIGVYLLLMAFGGYVIALYGGTWGHAIQLVFFAGAVIVLVVLLASTDVRRRLKVFLTKHFYRNKYDYRVEWLRFIDTLSSSERDVEPGETAIRAIAQIISSPGGLLCLRQESDGRFVPTNSWPRDQYDLQDCPQLAADDELVEFLERRQWVIDVEEYRQSPDVYGNIVLPGPFDTPSRFRMILPLLHGKRLMGFMALGTPPPPFKPNYEDRDLLKTVGRHVATHLAQHEADRRLAESRQFEAYHRLTAFVMHDLKNLAAQLSLIVANAERHKHNPEFVDDTISTVANSSERMQRLIEQLQGREVRSHLRTVSLPEIAHRASARCGPRLPVPRIDSGEGDLTVDADPERLTATLEHVIRNAQDATPEDGSVTVKIRADADACVVTIADTGVGMAESFIKDRLFKPFDTTKGSKGMGIGAFQVREYVLSLGGRVEVGSEPGRGTRFTLLLPLA